MSVITGGSLGGWRCRLRLAFGAGLVVASTLPPAAPAVSCSDAARVWHAAVSAFVIAAAAPAFVIAAAILGATAAGVAAAVAFEAATAA